MTHASNITRAIQRAARKLDMQVKRVGKVTPDGVATYHFWVYFNQDDIIEAKVKISAYRKGFAKALAEGVYSGLVRAEVEK